MRNERLPVSVEHASCLFNHASGDVVQALDDVSLAMSDRVSLSASLGKSGHGKSTLLRSIAGLNGLTGGRITVGGDPVRAPGGARHGLSGRHRFPLDARAGKC